jgi:bacterioferritin-associated ferredoxin
MYVCLCLGVTDHQLRETVAEGATSVEEVMYCTGAGTRCGTCRATVAAVVEEALEDQLASAEPASARGRCRLPVLGGRRATSAA